MHCSIVLIFIVIYLQVSKSNPCCTLANYNATRADFGQVFFQRLIHDRDAYRHVSDQNICSLMHLFIREAAHNGRSVHFSSGMFVLYDSTERFWTQLMLAKNAQSHSNEHRSGYIRRLRHFALDLINFMSQKLLGRKSFSYLPFIYMRGDESSHFHERGNKHDRWYLYPAYGMDITRGCMPNQFSHILFGKLRSLPNSTSHQYRGDRIYVKPETCGLQQFRHYLGHAVHFIRAVFFKFLCRYLSKFCSPEGTFHEWIDRKLIQKWNEILISVKTLTQSERQKMRDQALSEGIREIYRQTLLFPSTSRINDFRTELKNYYGDDVSARKGHEIIFTTNQLLARPNEQCDFISK